MSLTKASINGGDISSASFDDYRSVLIPIDNMAEYKELIELAQSQLKDLQETLDKLRSFNIQMKITF